MATRLSEKPFRIGFNLAGSAANTFTTQPISLPGVPSISIRRGDAKAMGVEVMAVISNQQTPDLEAGQDNAVNAALVKGAAPVSGGAENEIENSRCIWVRDIQYDGVTVTSVGEIFMSVEAVRFDDLTDHDGNGEIVMDNEIYIAVSGTGNASAKRTRGYMLCHLVELDANEAVFEMIEQV